MDGSANLDHTDLISQQAPHTLLVESKKKSGASLPASLWMCPHTEERSCSLCFGSYTHGMLGVHTGIPHDPAAISVTGSVGRALAMKMGGAQLVSLASTKQSGVIMIRHI